MDTQITFSKSRIRALQTVWVQHFSWGLKYDKSIPTERATEKIACAKEVWERGVFWRKGGKGTVALLQIKTALGDIA